MNTEAAIALWQLSYATDRIDAELRVAEASARGATSEQIDAHWVEWEKLNAKSVQVVRGDE